jgi:hypothetical protein
LIILSNWFQVEIRGFIVSLWAITIEIMIIIQAGLGDDPADDSTDVRFMNNF